MYNFVTLLAQGGPLTDLSLILLAAGSSSRFDMGIKKQWLRIDHKPLWKFVADNFAQTQQFSQIIIATAQEDIPFMQIDSDYTFVVGGASRQASLTNAIEKVTTPYVLVSDVARACISKELLTRIIAKRSEFDSIVPYLGVTDTIVYEDRTIDREQVKRIQTPQLAKTSLLKAALQTDKEFTDESSAIVAYGGQRGFVKGDEEAHKITFVHDLQKIPCLQEPSRDILSGNGFDVHAFSDVGPMYLGGVKIDVAYGFAAHSDGDVALHALIDALLGAAGLGDIGMLFPDNDIRYKGIDSRTLLKEVVAKLHSYGFVIVNVDLTIAAQKPRLSNYKAQMRTAIAAVLQIDTARVNVKATTTERLGFIGREEGVGVFANANLKYFNWKMIG